VYEVEAENEIRGHFQGNAIQFRNHKELIILDKNQLPGARVFYEEVYKKFSSEVDKLLGVNSMLERDAVYMKEIVKAKNERIEDLIASVKVCGRRCFRIRVESLIIRNVKMNIKIVKKSIRKKYLIGRNESSSIRMK
jgi:hypothetical protein